MWLGWSSHLYPLEARDLRTLPDRAAPLPDAALPPDGVIVLIRPDGEDTLVRGRARVAAAADDEKILTRVVFKPAIAKWNLPATLVRVWRNRYRYKGTHIYHISARDVRAMGLERTIRTTANPQKRGAADRAATMRKLLESLRTEGFRDDKPITVMLCRTRGRHDSVRQGHHRVSACLETGVDRMAMNFQAAGAGPWRKTSARLRWQQAVGAWADAHGARALELFLENKYINDAFFTCELGGRAAVVKCSSKAPASVANEYRLARRLFAAAPEVVAEPLACVERADNGAGAFVVTARAAGPSLTELLARGLSDGQADAFARDIRALARALRATGILHRDLFSDNLLLGADGHLKAIDWQLAIDRNDYREDPWVERHWKFHYVVFGVNRELGLGVWNDFRALANILAAFPQTPAVREVRRELDGQADALTFARPPRGLTKIKLRLYALSLRLQMRLRGRRHRKYPQLLRRWRTVTERA